MKVYLNDLAALVGGKFALDDTECHATAPDGHQLSVGRSIDLVLAEQDAQGRYRLVPADLAGAE